MTNAVEATRQTLDALGVSTADAVAAQFVALRAEFDREAARVAAERAG